MLAAVSSIWRPMSRDNLSNLHPHPLYAAWYYSHPPVVERVENLRRLVSKKEGASASTLTEA